MEYNTINEGVAKRSALIYVPISVGAALLFWVIASLIGDYPSVARIGGAVWVLLLTTIVTMPMVTSEVKKRASRAGNP